MDQRRFDSLTRSLATPKSRRGFLGTLAAIAAGLGARRAAVAQAQCGNVSCKTNPGKCGPGCVCCVYGNGNSRCRPPGTCSPGTAVCAPGEVVDPLSGCVTTTTTTTTTAAPTTTTSPTTTAAPTTTTTTTTTAAPACGPGCVSDACVERACVGGVCQETPPSIIITFPCFETICDPVQGYIQGAPKVCNTPGPGQVGPGECIATSGCVYPSACAACQTFNGVECVSNCPADTVTSCTDGQPGVCNVSTGLCAYTSICQECEACGFSRTCEPVADGTVVEIPAGPGVVFLATCCGGARSIITSCDPGVCGTRLANGNDCCGDVFEDQCCLGGTWQDGVCCASEVINGVCCPFGTVNLNGKCCPSGSVEVCTGFFDVCCDKPCVCPPLSGGCDCPG